MYSRCFDPEKEKTIRSSSSILESKHLMYITRLAYIHLSTGCCEDLFLQLRLARIHETNFSDKGRGGRDNFHRKRFKAYSGHYSHAPEINSV
jgi:hypothetical protein